MSRTRGKPAGPALEDFRLFDTASPWQTEFEKHSLLCREQRRRSGRSLPAAFRGSAGGLFLFFDLLFNNPRLGNAKKAALYFLDSRSRLPMRSEFFPIPCIKG